MSWQKYSIFFDTAFICTPYLLTIVFPAKPKLAGKVADEVRRKTLYLLAATVASLAIMLAAHRFYTGSGNLALWVLFFPLWFLGAMRIMPLKRPSWFAINQKGSNIRTATLTSRLSSSPIPSAAWLLIWLLPVVSTIFVLLNIDDLRDMTNMAPLFMLTGAYFWAGLGNYGARWFLVEPEPMDKDNSEELTLAYERLRKVKLWGWYCVVGAATGIFCAVAVFTLLEFALTSIVWTGAGGGTLVGIFGGVYGTYCTILRGRTNELRVKLEEQSG